jgi:uncharacterized GH25 family protein
MKLQLAILLISNSALSLLAHDLYLMPQKFHAAKGERILISAHTGDSFPLSEQPVDPARLASLPASEWRILGKATHATYALEQAGANVFGVYTKARYLELEAAKFRAYLEEEGLTKPLSLLKPGQKGREMYAKFAKTIVATDGASSDLSKPLGLKIEIVPLSNPSTLKPGDSLAVQLLFDGKPLADTQMELAVTKGTWAKLRTDAQGKATFQLPVAAKYRLHAVHMEQVSQPTHDWESFWASFTFEVGQEPSKLSVR